MQGEQANAPVVDLDVKAIYFMVALDDDRGQFGIAVDQGLDRFLDLVFDQTTHVKNLFAELFQLFFVLFVSVLGNHCETPSISRNGR
jgi:hypothetical protein